MSQSPSQLSAITASTTSHQPSTYHSVPGVILFNTPSTTGSPAHRGSFTGERDAQPDQPGHAAGRLRLDLVALFVQASSRQSTTTNIICKLAEGETP
ncbi:hypothetical protein PC9H_009342 [Pleurotus ostreatus]|uniref:Uncharacterized protein n=1 Tax=Pleurotus ostreatus TaxID=5322 RepID=A0A8H6ZPI8_PLEOS|nr:uncharacterized protein PC9H_009342 [Pleurotus ostreatus]KAF7424042.1 hypothetical protein PC9H_009342 [Pleurotus ostreatus]KAJ8693144.1 hypothetical protein PTI98_010386 [Pleurotus ostreatus]